MNPPLSLTRAISENRLAEFIEQEERRGVGPTNQQNLDAALARIIKGGQSAGQTSRSPSAGGSTEK